MSYDPTPHLTRIKGALYLEVKFRLLWLREEQPAASVEVELTHLDLDSKLAVSRATVTLPNGTKATEIGSETERDFPAGWIEKSATKAVGRALAALGYGTQFALDLDEGNVADAPVPATGPTAGLTGTVAPSLPTEPASASTSSAAATRLPSTPTSAPFAGSTTTAPSKPPVGDGDPNDIREAIYALLADDPEADDKLPKPVLEQTYDELQKTLAWLHKRQAERKPFGSSYRDLRTALAEGRTTDDLLGVKKAIGDAHRKTLTDAGYTALMQYHGVRQAELAKSRVPAASTGAGR